MSQHERRSFHTGKQIDSATPGDLLGMKDRIVRTESIPIESIHLGDRVDQNLVDELVKEYRDDMSMIKRGLVKAAGKTNNIRYEMLTRPEEVVAFSKLGMTEFDVVAIYNDPEFTVENASVKELLFLGKMGTAVSRLEQHTAIKTLEFDEGDDEDNLDGPLVDEDEELFDREHAQIVGGGVIKQGQASPLTAAAWQDHDSRLHRSVTDGYHRGKELKMRGIKEAKVTMWYGWDESDIFIQRIQAAASVRSIALARFGIWSRQLYKRTEWQKREIPMSSIISLAITDTSGKRLGIEGDDNVRAKAWARRMAKAFRGSTGLKLESMLPYVRAFERSFPPIIKRIRRASGGGKEGSGVFTPTKFLRMVEIIPEDLERQRFVVALNKDHNFTVQQFGMVAAAVARLRSDRIWNSKFQNDPLSEARKILKKTKEDEASKSSPEGSSMLRAGTIFSYKDGSGTGGRSGNAAHVHPDVVDALHRAAEKPRNTDTWLATPELSPHEISVLQMYIEDGYLFDEIAQKMSITENLVDRYLNSALTKINLHKRSLREAREAREAQRRSRDMH